MLILYKRISWIVAQTIVRQLVSKVQHVDLISALPHEAPETFNGVGRLNVPVHDLRKLVAFLGTRTPSPHLFVSFQIHCQGRQNDEGYNGTRKLDRSIR